MPLPEKYTEIAARVRNWGRWGSADQIGTLNFIDDAARLRGVRSVVSGRAFSLAIPMSADGPQMGFIPGRINPQHSMIMLREEVHPGAERGWNDDAIAMGVQAATHWDALSHAYLGDSLYNGYPADSITEAGATQCGIHHVKSLVTRGVLLDIARARGVDRVEGGSAITPADLDAALALTGIDLEPGDVVLMRTGHIQLFLSGDKMTYATTAPGPGMEAAEWFHQKSVAAVAIDNLIFEVFPCEDPEFFLPVHFLHLIEMGLTQGQNWMLEELASDCARDGKYDFLLSASPEPIVNGTGAMVNPVAVK